MVSRLAILVSAFVVLRGSPAEAIVIDFVPTDQTVDLGGAVSVDLVISDLGNFTAPSLGAFDLDVSYDPSVLSATSVTLTTLLGDSTETFEGVDLSMPGLIDLFLVSLLSPLELDSLQPASFVLLTLSFDTVATGTSALELTDVVLGDALGAELSAIAGSGSITVRDTGIPEPPLAALVVAAGLAILRRRTG